jgi:hypothetical protein
VKLKYTIFVDADDSASGKFLVGRGEIDQATRFPFEKTEGLFYIE